MSLRGQLVVAFVLLAVLPLLGVTLYSYTTSLAAFRGVVERETLDLADQMSAQTQAAGRELERRLGQMQGRVREGWSQAFLEARRQALERAEAAEIALTLHGVLASIDRTRGEVPFALAADGRLLASSPEDRERLSALPLDDAVAGGVTSLDTANWVVVLEREPVSGATLGIARPIGDSLGEIRRTAVRNLGWGLALVGVALLGILPLSTRMTHNLERLTEGAERLARGDLEARVPVRSADEFGRLAETFNRMAVELAANQQRMIEEERLRRELEMCRAIQTELLPRAPLTSGPVEVRGESVPAREVGGDFFNYFPIDGQRLGILVGDVSGKGVAAALLMANLQATLRGRLPQARDLDALALELDDEIFAGTPPATYLTLFMAVLDGESRRLRWVNAGHTPPFVLRASGEREWLEATGRPLGLLPGGGFEEHGTVLGPDDRLFVYTDGLTEAEDSGGDPFGPQRLEEVLLGARRQDAPGLMASVARAIETHRGPAEPSDDATMVLVSMRPGAHGGAAVSLVREGAQ